MSEYKKEIAVAVSVAVGVAALVGAIAIQYFPVQTSGQSAAPPNTGALPTTSSTVSRAGTGTFTVGACTKAASNPLIETGVVEAPSASVLKNGGVFMMWFSAKLGNVSGIYAANSSDAAIWTVDSNPVLRPGPSGAWDSGVIYSPDVIWNGSMYLMYYSGSGKSAFRVIGVAFSSDGYHWTKYSENPIITPGPGFYDSWWSRFASVVFDSGTYEMWYTGHTLTNTSQPWYIAVDHATSDDGLRWTKYVNNPVYGEAQWSGKGSLPFVDHPSVLEVNGTFVMIADNGQEISYLTSSDGTNWTPGGTTLIAPSGGLGWDANATLYPSAVLNGSKILVWYTGYSEPINGQSGTGTVGIGLATCALQTPDSVTIPASLPTTHSTTSTTPATVAHQTEEPSTSSTISTTLTRNGVSSVDKPNFG